MNKRHIVANKYMLLAMIIIAMLAMSGCRTRITNNSEVSNVHYDEDGFLSEVYQMRRDELGLSTAERPILPDLGSPESDDDFDNSEDENTLQNYEPEPEEPYVEPPQTNTTTTNTNTSTTTHTTHRHTHTPTTTPTEEVTITFSPGKRGKISGMKKGESSKKTVKKNSSVTPPEAIRKGYTLIEWKSRDGKISIKPGSKKTVSKNETFTAQWEKNNDGGGDTPKPSPENWQIAFDTDGGSSFDADKVEKGKKYKLPTKTPTKNGYVFRAWKLEDGSEHEPGKEIDITKDTIITATWDPTAETKWSDALKAEINNNDIPEALFIMGDDSDSAFVQDCKAAVAKGAEEPEFVIAFAKNTDQKLIELSEEKNDDGTLKYEGMTMIVISETAKNDKYKLTYQIKLMKLLHEDKSELDIDAAAQELLEMSGEDINIVVQSNYTGEDEGQPSDQP